jgi:hypothetical protein
MRFRWLGISHRSHRTSVCEPNAALGFCGAAHLLWAAVKITAPFPSWEQHTLGWRNKGARDQWDMYTWGNENSVNILVGQPERRLGCRCKDNIKMNLRDIAVWGCRLYSVGSGWGPMAVFLTRKWTFGFHKSRKCFGPAELLSPSAEGLCHVKLIQCSETYMPPQGFRCAADFCNKLLYSQVIVRKRQYSHLSIYAVVAFLKMGA